MSFIRVTCVGLMLLALIGADAKDDGAKKADGFTFKEKPIHPGVVWEFDVWLSDGPVPKVTTVDLEAATSSNKNFMPPESMGQGYLETRDGGLEPKENDRHFAYRHVGVSSGGTHVLQTESWGGGTMRAMDVFLVRFDTEDYFIWPDGSEKPETQKRPVLKCVAQIVLGDRDDASVNPKGDVLTLGKSRYRDKPVVYRLP